MRVQEKREALALFPNALEGFILPKIHELQKKIALTRASASEKLHKQEQFPDGWFLREYLKAYDIKDILDAQNEVKRLEGYLPPKKYPHTARIDDERVSRARECDILEVAKSGLEGLKKCGSKYFARCPYHKEKSASFCLYLQTQSFYCFGCTRHGDVIDLVQELMGISFVDAIKYLTPSYG